MRTARSISAIFSARADVLAACNTTVLISNYFEYYRLAAYLGSFTKKMIGIALGAASLSELFDEKYYTNLDGGILEAIGRLFKNDVKVYVYPLRNPASGELTTVQNLQVAPSLKKLYEYLVEKGCLVQLDNYNPAYLPIFSRDVLAKIKAGDNAWERLRAAGGGGSDPPPQLLRLQEAGGERAGGMTNQTLDTNHDGYLGIDGFKAGHPDLPVVRVPRVKKN